MVVAKQSTETFAALDAAGRIADLATGVDQLVFQILMISVPRGKAPRFRRVEF
jgi:hypothetical protein